MHKGCHMCVFCMYSHNGETAFTINMTDNLEQIKNVHYWDCSMWLVCLSLTVKNLVPNVAKLTIPVGSEGSSWSFWQILVNLNSVFLIHGTSAGQHKRFETFNSFMFPMRILFIPGYAYWKRVVFFFVAHPTCCILVVLTKFWLF